MTTKSPSIFIAFRPLQTLHLAQPVFRGLRKQGYDVYMDIDNTTDGINLNQIAARPFFFLILAPGSLENLPDEQDPLRAELEHALRLQRYIVLLPTRDFAPAELERYALGPLAGLKTVPAVMLEPRQLQVTLDELTNHHLTARPRLTIYPAPAADQPEVERRVMEAREYTTDDMTIRLLSEKVFFRGTVRLRQGEYQAALADFDEAIKSNPNNESAYLQRGHTRRRMNNFQGALRDYEHALQLSPKLVEALISRGEVLFETGKYVQALSSFDRALALQSDSYQAIAGLAVTRHVLGHVDEALDLWRWLVERSSNYADAAWVQQRFGWEQDLTHTTADLIRHL